MSFPSSKNSHSQNEAQRNHFHCNSFPLGLNLKQRLGATQKWPISNWEMELVGNFFVSIFLFLTLSLAFTDSPAVCINSTGP